MKRLTLFLLGFLAFGWPHSVLAAGPDKQSEKRQPADAVAIRHFEKRDGWARAETANFRIYHNQPRSLVEKIARIAERVRQREADKWFGGFPENWNPRCEIILHATSSHYRTASGVPPGTPGHSTVNIDAGRVVSRRVEVHCDDPSLMVLTVLPHEVTHVVLGGQFGKKRVPRWADEGMAILSEPRVQLDDHLSMLDQCHRERKLYHVRDLMRLVDYPEPRYVTAFYAQSVSLVDFLVREKDARVFTAFLREAVAGDYERSLRRHYGYRSFDELHQKWKQKALAGAADAPRGTAVAAGR